MINIAHNIEIFIDFFIAIIVPVITDLGFIYGTLVGIRRSQRKTKWVDAAVSIDEKKTTDAAEA